MGKVLRTTVVNKHHNVPYDIYIGRGSIWGNPFSHIFSTKTVTMVKTREEAVERYREWILTQPHLMKKVHKLKGKTLACYCKPKCCHGDVLAEMADTYHVCQKCGEVAMKTLYEGGIIIKPNGHKCKKG